MVRFVQGMRHTSLIRFICIALAAFALVAVVAAPQALFADEETGESSSPKSASTSSAVEAEGSSSSSAAASASSSTAHIKAATNSSSSAKAAGSSGQAVESSEQSASSSKESGSSSSKATSSFEQGAESSDHTSSSSGQASSSSAADGVTSEGSSSKAGSSAADSVTSQSSSSKAESSSAHDKSLLPLDKESQDSEPAEDASGSDEGEVARYSVELVRKTLAPSFSGGFFIEEDGTALTTDEYLKKYVDGQEELVDDQDGPEEYYEDDTIEVNLNDNGWFLDLDDFRWHFWVDDEHEYAEGDIPDQYTEAAKTDGIAFGLLHDLEFGGTWYFSADDACWHFIDANDVDHARPSPEFLAAQYEQFADPSANDNPVDSSSDPDPSANDNLDDSDSEAFNDTGESGAPSAAGGEDEGFVEPPASDVDGGDTEDTLRPYDDERWEYRVVGYGFREGDDVSFAARVKNEGTSTLVVRLDSSFNSVPTASAVGGVYPIDGSGTHPATEVDYGTHLPASVVDNGEQSATNNQDDADASSVPSDDSESSNASSESMDASDEEGQNALGAPFSSPIFTSVSGEGVAWLNEEVSKGSVVAPEISIAPGCTAEVEYSVQMQTSGAMVLSATAEDDGHGYANIAHVQVLTTQSDQDESSSSSAHTLSTMEETDASDVDQSLEGESDEQGNNQDSLDTVEVSAIAHVPVMEGVYHYAINDIPSISDGAEKPTRAWKMSGSALEESSSSATHTSVATTPTRKPATTTPSKAATTAGKATAVTADDAPTKSLVAILVLSAACCVLAYFSGRKQETYNKR